MTDGRGGSEHRTARIDAGNKAPYASIDSPGSSDRFGSARRSRCPGRHGPRGRDLPESALTWQVIKHHATHTHPFLPPTAGNHPHHGTGARGLLGHHEQLSGSSPDSYRLARSQPRRSAAIPSPSGSARLRHGASPACGSPPTASRLVSVTSWEAWDLDVQAPIRRMPTDRGRRSCRGPTAAPVPRDQDAPRRIRLTPRRSRATTPGPRVPPRFGQRSCLRTDRAIAPNDTTARHSLTAPAIRPARRRTT